MKKAISTILISILFTLTLTTANAFDGQDDDDLSFHRRRNPNGSFGSMFDDAPTPRPNPFDAPYGGQNFGGTQKRRNDDSWSTLNPPPDPHQNKRQDRRGMSF